MTWGFVLGLVGGTLGIAAGATVFALGLAFAPQGFSVFGIGGTAYAGAGAATWAVGVAMLALGMRAYRSQPRVALACGGVSESNKVGCSNRTTGLLFLIAALGLMGVAILRDDPKFLLIGVMNLVLGAMYAFRRQNLAGR